MQKISQKFFVHWLFVLSIGWLTASPATAQVKHVQMKIDGYLCGN